MKALRPVPAICNRRLWGTAIRHCLVDQGAMDGDCKSPARAAALLIPHCSPRASPPCSNAPSPRTSSPRAHARCAAANAWTRSTSSSGSRTMATTLRRKSRRRATSHCAAALWTCFRSPVRGRCGWSSSGMNWSPCAPSTRSRRCRARAAGWRELSCLRRENSGCSSGKWGRG